VGALALLLAGCAPLPTSDTAAAPSGPADPTAIFRYANTIGVSRFDPHRASSSTDNTLLFLTYDRLVHTDGEGRAVPGLATAWEALDGGRVLRLDLRPGVTFHDGTPFDAAAVKANIERAKTVTGSAVRAELASIASVDDTGPLQVRLNLSAPNAALPLILSDRAGSMVSPAAFDKPDLDQAPVGAGMYRVMSYAPGSRVEYRPAPGYWDPGAVRVAGIDMLIYTDAVTRLNAVRTGEVDATVLSPDQVPEAQSAGVTVTPGRTNNFYYLQPNRARPQFADVRVRRALWHAIDRRALVDGLARGFGELDAQPAPSWSFAHDPTIGDDPYPYDPARAKQLLAEAGYPDGFGFEVFAPRAATRASTPRRCSATWPRSASTCGSGSWTARRSRTSSSCARRATGCRPWAAGGPTRPRPPACATPPTASTTPAARPRRSSRSCRRTWWPSATRRPARRPCTR
jgi:peptide/nickel transport system substrate-binding protein